MSITKQAAASGMQRVRTRLFYNWEVRSASLHPIERMSSNFERRTSRTPERTTHFSVGYGVAVLALEPHTIVVLDAVVVEVSTPGFCYRVQLDSGYYATVFDHRGRREGQAYSVGDSLRVRISSSAYRGGVVPPGQLL
jgi:hypothetical protein